MLKYILLLSLLWVHCVARGQTGYNYRYWFDNDYSTLRQGYSATENWQVNAEIDELSESLHTIHFQVVDSKGIESVPVTRFFLKMRDASVKKAVYWFDGNRTAQRTLDQAQGEFSIDVTELSEGFHTFYYQAIGENSSLSSVISRPFLKIAVPENMRYRCWIDNDSTALVSGKLTTGPVLVDVSQISEGYHVMHVQVEDIMPSTIISKPFVKIPQIEGVEYLKCLCIVDNKLYKEENVSSLGGIVNWDFDVSSLAQGFHSMQIQVLTPSGAATSVYNAYFLRTTTNEEMADMKCVYAIDGNIFNTMAGHMENGLFHCDIDVSNLEDGLHQITYKLSNGKGVETKTQTHYFIKTPLGGPGIVEYHYWLNKNTEKKHIVKLEKRVNPFNLITLLPFEQEPLRSECFHFEIKDNKPMMYAKNDIHIRFYDASGRFTDASKRFNDYRVSQEVKPVGELLATQTFPKVAENDIRWYTMQAAPGDTVAFKLSQPATMQLFAPSGEEVFKTSESASVNWNGIHTWEKGTYYLAVHDVTGSQSTMKLEYMHMDKYDVVDWDVRRVGNGGCSTITFKGNGFRDLYAVDLYNAQGDTIRSVDVSHDSDAETAVTFDFTDATLGDYNAVFHFTEEDKHIANVVTVEEAVDIELATDVTFPRTFLRGTSTTYTIKITNKGNMTAYSVPVYSYLMNGNQEDCISQIRLEGFNLPNLLDVIDIDSISVAERAELLELIDEIGDEHYFQCFKAEVQDSPGDSVWVRCGYFFTDIAPHETKTLRLNVTADEEVTAYFSIPKEWGVFSGTKKELFSHANMSVKKANLKDKYCCYHEKIECFLDVGSLVADMVEIGLAVAAGFTEGATLPAALYAKWTGCALSSISTASSISASFLCDTEKSFGEKLKEQGPMNLLSTWATVLSCQPGEVKAAKMGVKFSKELLKNWKSLLKGSIKWGDNGSGFFQCRSNPQNVDGCPPIPPGGGSSSPYTPVDPNDIYGYLSQAGSKFITDSVAKVNYTIEFENDTAFATAAAHTIVIKDTLDKKYFVLEEFMPTGVRIGDREVFLKETEVKTQNDVTSFVKTIDMRPEINAIAQVDGTFSTQTGIAQWTFQSLDPMTMEPTYDLMQGILPVNFDGTSGIGEVMFEIGVKQGKADGAEIKNRASIVFDYEDAILTPTWTNIVDAVAPSSAIDNSWMVNDSTLRITAEAFDARSGVWKYEWYVQAGENAPWWKEGETDSLSFDYHIYEGIDYGFCVVATDSAGNVEQKVIHRERGFKTYGQDYEDTIVDVPADSNNDAPDAIYDLSGRKHAEPQENRVNIIGKKKVLFRRERQ